MRNLAIINIVGLSPLAYQNILEGASAFKRTLEWGNLIPEASGIVLLARVDSPLPDETVVMEPGATLPFAPIRAIVKEVWSEELLVEALSQAAKFSAAEKSSSARQRNGDSNSPNRYEAMFYIWGDSPLIDNTLSQTLWELHYKYDAEYSFADGYPYGLAPEILSPTLPGKLRPLASGRSTALARDSLFEILRQDINAFDVETHLSPEDLRMDRVSLTCDTLRNRNILERLIAAGGSDAQSICQVIAKQKILLRSLPAFFPIQITDHCPQNCSYCPFPTLSGDPRDNKEHMDVENFTALCKKIVDFAGDAVIALSLWGEPASHPEIGTLIRLALDAAPDVRVLIETSGIGWKNELLEELASEVKPGRLMWIVSLDASEPELYSRLRGDGLAEAEACADTLNRLFGSYCWIQAVRMEENEEHLDVFYPRWKEKGAQVIVQKYNSYANLLSERQPADLSPLNRFPCWHLKRDMPILLDGRVPICQTDMGRREVLGNAFTDSLRTIWAASEPLFESHVEGIHPSVCAQCDEYYTFNF